MRAVLAAFLSSLAAPLAASDLVLALPIDCDLGKTCFIQQYVDHDPGPGALDFTCGRLSYDGHKGTDFGLPTHAARLAGVDVLAAASGVVQGVRDAMPDTGLSEQTAAALQGRDCGNGVVLRHEDGWETQYCHMAKGSVTVRQGDQVTTGDVLGQVGFSGRTQFPHLHLSVRKDGTVTDPFSAGSGAGCIAGPSLWAETPPYVAGRFLDIGFSDAVPDYEAIKDGTAASATLPGTAPALVLFGYAFGGQAGDVVQLTITGPEGAVIHQSLTLDKAQAQFFRAVGKRLRAARWTAGNYSGTVSLIRNGVPIDSLATRIKLD